MPLYVPFCKVAPIQSIQEDAGVHNPREYLKIDRDRADLQNCTPCQPPQYPCDMTHDKTVQVCAVPLQKLLKVKDYRVPVHRGSTRIINPT
jgi:hypothetical protein